MNMTAEEFAKYLAIRHRITEEYAYRLAIAMRPAPCQLVEHMAALCDFGISEDTVVMTACYMRDSEMIQSAVVVRDDGEPVSKVLGHAKDADSKDQS